MKGMVTLGWVRTAWSLSHLQKHEEIVPNATTNKSIWWCDFMGNPAGIARSDSLIDIQISTRHVTPN